MTYLIENLTESQKAVRLIYKGLRPRLSAFQDAEYARLLDHYDASPEFRVEVERLAAMMDLAVIHSDTRKIILRPEVEESLFAMRLGDIRQNAPELDRGLLVVLLIAVGAVFFRTGGDLVARGDHDPEFTAEQIENIINELCLKLQEENPEDPDRQDEQFMEVWRRLLSKPRRRPGEQRASMGSRLSMINLLIGRMVEHDMLIENRAGEIVSYVPTERFRQQLKDVMENEIYEKCIRRLGIKTARDESIFRFTAE
jgi:hypothetical protein